MSVDPRLARARQAQSAVVVAAPPPPPPPPPSPPADLPVVVSNGTVGLDGAQDDQPVTNGTTSAADTFKLRFCTVCASNNNRSMEGHLRLSKANYPVISFGTGSLVRLPGPSISQPNVYNFNDRTYNDMYNELDSKDPRLYRANGILNMLERNRNVKGYPERWQDWPVGQSRVDHLTDKGSQGVEGGVVDIVITCEERCWDAVVENLLDRGSPLNRPVHVFNIDIKDSHEEALIGGNAMVDLADKLNEAAIEERESKGAEGWDQGGGHGRESFDDRVPDILAEWQERWPQFPAQWTLAWF